jgi:polyketide synthase PksN
MTGEEVYAALAAAGLDNGPAFQVIDEVLFWAGGAVARLTLPPAAGRDPGDVLHPALVNGAFQAVVAAMGQEDADNRAEPRLYLPFSIGRIDIGDALPDECEVEIHRSDTASSAVRRFDLTIADREGRALFAVRDFALIEAQNR